MLAVAAAVVLGLFLSTIVKSHAFTLDDKNEPHFETGTVAVSIGNVRSKPTLNSSVVYKLKAGDTVTFLKKRDEWYILELHDGVVGWAHERLFRTPHGTLEDRKTGAVTDRKAIGLNAGYNFGAVVYSAAVEYRLDGIARVSPL